MDYAEALVSIKAPVESLVKEVAQLWKTLGLPSEVAKERIGDILEKFQGTVDPILEAEKAMVKKAQGELTAARDEAVSMANEVGEELRVSETLPVLDQIEEIQKERVRLEPFRERRAEELRELTLKIERECQWLGVDVALYTVPDGQQGAAGVRAAKQRLGRLEALQEGRVTEAGKARARINSMIEELGGPLEFRVAHEGEMTGSDDGIVVIERSAANERFVREVAEFEDATRREVLASGRFEAHLRRLEEMYVKEVRGPKEPRRTIDDIVRQRSQPRSRSHVQKEVRDNGQRSDEISQDSDLISCVGSVDEHLPGDGSFLRSRSPVRQWRHPRREGRPRGGPRGRYNHDRLPPEDNGPPSVGPPRRRRDDHAGGRPDYYVENGGARGCSADSRDPRDRRPPRRCRDNSRDAAATAPRLARRVRDNSREAVGGKGGRGERFPHDDSRAAGRAPRRVREDSKEASRWHWRAPPAGGPQDPAWQGRGRADGRRSPRRPEVSTDGVKNPDGGRGLPPDRPMRRRLADSRPRSGPPPGPPPRQNRGAPRGRGDVYAPLPPSGPGAADSKSRTPPRQRKRACREDRWPERDRPADRELCRSSVRAMQGDWVDRGGGTLYSVVGEVVKRDDGRTFQLHLDRGFIDWGPQRNYYAVAGEGLKDEVRWISGATGRGAFIWERRSPQERRLNASTTNSEEATGTKTELPVR